MKHFGSAAWNGGPHEGTGSVSTESYALPPHIMRNDKQLESAKYASRSICHRCFTSQKSIGSDTAVTQ
jgi:hypothetical protein